MAKSRRSHTRGFTSVPLRQLFFDRVWEAVRAIPPGQVATYGQIASMIPQPDGVTVQHFRAARARWVGQAMARCPADAPWHRVVNAQGKVSLRKGGNGHLIQRSILEKEGVSFDRGGRVDLETFGWNRSDFPVAKIPRKGYRKQ
jgi:methylated-DNA-protein-cysteine methyltransferase-like protein